MCFVGSNPDGRSRIVINKLNMYLIENLIFIVIAIAILIYVIRHTNEWTRKAQKRDLENAEKSSFNFVPPERWNSKFMFNIRRFGIIFSTIALLLLAYALILGSTS